MMSILSLTATNTIRLKPSVGLKQPRYCYVDSKDNSDTCLFCSLVLFGPHSNTVETTVCERQAQHLVISSNNKYCSKQYLLYFFSHPQEFFLLCIPKKQQPTSTEVEPTSLLWLCLHFVIMFYFFCIVLSPKHVSRSGPGKSRRSVHLCFCQKTELFKRQRRVLPHYKIR